VEEGHRVYVGRADDPGPALAAAEYDEWAVVSVSEEGDVLAEAEGSYFVIRDDADPRGVDVTALVRTMTGLPPA
jgi:hypothetical protein